MSLEVNLALGGTTPRIKRTSININDPNESRYWCQAFNCTEEQLRAAVQSVGSFPESVAIFLGQNDEAVELTNIKNAESLSYEVEGDDELEDIDFSEYDISASPNDFNTKTLFDFISSSVVRIPGFQRNYVWDLKRASKLIESLIIGLPIPQIFLYQEARNKFIVIDGQQRYMTIYYFMNKRFPRKEKRFELRQIFDRQGDIPKDILSNNDYFTDFNLDLPGKLPKQTNKYNKKNYDTLDDESRISFNLRTIRNVIIKQNYPENDHSAVYEIFNRLNTGGVNLKPQEIRTSLYHSYFYDMLYKVNMNESWRQFTPYPTPDINMKDIEILLRGYAMLESWQQYSPSMTRFLNSYSEKAKKFNDQKLSLLKEIFNSLMAVCSKFNNKRIFFSENNRFNISLFESVFVGACHKAFTNNNSTVLNIREEQVNTLKTDLIFVDASKFDTAGTANVKRRMLRAIEILR